MTLTEFLLARIAEDEADAREYDDDGTVGTWSHWALAQCEAMRRIVELHGDHGESQGYIDGSRYGYIEHTCSTCGSPDEYGEPWPCATIKVLALPYAAHPDYDEEWRP